MFEVFNCVTGATTTFVRTASEAVAITNTMPGTDYEVAPIGAYVVQTGYNTKGQAVTTITGPYSYREATSRADMGNMASDTSSFEVVRCGS